MGKEIEMENKIKCPKCGFEIELTKALTGQIEESIKSKYEAQAAAMNEKYQTTINKIHEEADQSANKRIKELVEAEREKAAEQQILLETDLEAKQIQLIEANKKELELRRQQQILEDEKANFELIVQRKLDEERREIVEQASRRAVEQEQLKLREKDDQLAIMKKQIDELKRRAEVSSQEAAGEALEEELQELLQRTFPYDRFEEVKKGIRGADITQRVRNATGKFCGTIVWESKNTKEFTPKWIEKLRKDQQEAKADIAILVTVALPKEIENFGQQKDIWITSWKFAIGLATVLRHTLIEVTRQKIVSAGQASMKDLVYEYVTGREFAMHIKVVASAFKLMQEDLETEKRAISRIWKKREKQIVAVLENIAGMRGSIEGLTQKALPEVEVLSLETIE